DAYPELGEKEETIQRIILIEEQRFQETIEQGLHILESLIEELKEKNLDEITGEDVFKLYDTYGFPLDLTKEIIEEENMKVDEEGFQREMEKQRQRARN